MTCSAYPLAYLDTIDSRQGFNPVHWTAQFNNLKFNNANLTQTHFLWSAGEIATVPLPISIWTWGKIMYFSKKLWKKKFIYKKNFFIQMSTLSSRTRTLSSCTRTLSSCTHTLSSCTRTLSSCNQRWVNFPEFEITVCVSCKMSKKLNWPFFYFILFCENPT